MRLLLTFFLLLVLGVAVVADAQSLGRQTSSSCQIGNMKKGATGKRCEVPIPASCTVATNQATNTRWTDIEKSGGLACRFDNRLTDWKTRIAGACGVCQARQCSAKFTVYFDCP